MCTLVLTGILLFFGLFSRAFLSMTKFECSTMSCWITYMLTLAIRGLALSTTRIILMLKMQ